MTGRRAKKTRDADEMCGKPVPIKFPSRLKMARAAALRVDRALLSSRPSNHRFRDLNAWLIRKRDRERKGFPRSHRQISGESPPSIREIPDGTLALEGSRVVCGGALHAEAGVGTNREGHECLATQAHCKRVGAKAQVVVSEVCFSGRDSWGDNLLAAKFLEGSNRTPPIALQICH